MLPKRSVPTWKQAVTNNQTLTVNLGARSYPIYIGERLLSTEGPIVAHLAQKRAAVVTDSIVAPLYLEELTAALGKAGVEVLPIVVAAGEETKNTQTLNTLYDELLAHRCERKTTVIALGGGVIGDLAGYAAATYLRGVPYVQVPTTLLAQVDSAVGGKTAINHPRGKNMIGAFYQPRAVVADIATLTTLPPRELSAGLAEVIKYGLIRDAEFFEWLEGNIDALVGRDAQALAYAVRRSCENKAAVVALDEREEGQARALLNLGHTFGHAIETGLGYGSWLHGEAVAAGTVIAARTSAQLGLLSADAVERITALLRRAQLPVQAPDLGFERYQQLMGLDKKVEDGKVRFILLRAIGSAFVTADVPQSALAAALRDSTAHG
jgi:3-dehydroquinate synthase